MRAGPCGPALFFPSSTLLGRDTGVLARAGGVSTGETHVSRQQLNDYRGFHGPGGVWAISARTCARCFLMSTDAVASHSDVSCPRSASTAAVHALPHPVSTAHAPQPKSAELAQ